MFFSKYYAGNGLDSIRVISVFILIVIKMRVNYKMTIGELAARAHGAFKNQINYVFFPAFLLSY